jgi:hypothetical protein
MVFSLIVQFVCTLVMRAMVEAGKSMNNRNRDLYPKIGFTCGSWFGDRFELLIFRRVSTLSVVDAHLQGTAAITRHSRFPNEGVTRASSFCAGPGRDLPPKKTDFFSDCR